MSLLIAALLLASIPALLVAVAPPAPEGEPMEAIVHLPPSEIARLAPGVEVVEAYESFAIVRAPEETLARFDAIGVAVESMDAASVIGLDAISFDVRLGEPALPADLRQAETDARELYLVHVIGPAKLEWLAEIRAVGGRVLHYVPTHAFLVSMEGPAREAVRGLRFVDWVGPYHPAYKVHPDMSSQEGLLVVQVITVDPADTGTVVSALTARGLPRLTRSAAGAGILSVFRAGELGVVRARVDPSWVADLARIPEVLGIEPWHEMHLVNQNAQALLQTGLAPSDANARRLWDNNLRGAGQVVTAADTGVDFDNNMFRESVGTVQKGQIGDTTGTLGPESIYNTTDPTRRKLIRYMTMSLLDGIDPWTSGDPETYQDSVSDFDGCPSGHGSGVTGNAAGWDGGIGTSAHDGMAPDAKLIIQDIGTVGPSQNCGGADGDLLTYIPDDYTEMFGPALANGSRIHTNSWGSSDNGYDIQARMVDRFVWDNPEMAVFFASGNGGPALFTVGSPGTSKSAITIGGANPYPGQEALSGSSSRGPTEDGRLKPDITTFFSGTTAGSSGNPIDNSNNAQTRGFGGTSHATPLAAGMAAIAREYFVEGWYPTGQPVPANGFEPTAALVKALLAASSRKMTGGSANVQDTYPNQGQGWGRLVLDDALYLDPGLPDLRKLWVVDQRNGLMTGQSVDYEIRVAGSTTPLRIVLVWSDYPALSNANPALVNNLNLQVTGPTGSVYRGNVFGTFAQGESLANSGSFDNRNPIEGVIVTAPAAGVWTVHVEGANVPSGPQGYAIVAVADIDPGFGDLRLDKKVYSESDTIRMEVHDTNAGSVDVLVKSTIEAGGETVSLAETAPGSGVWRGTIDTAFGDPATDGVLQVSEGASIEAVYSDGDPAHDALATATVDASAPAISNVRAEDITNAAATAKWTTNEGANSKVYFGTSPVSLTGTAFDSGLVTAHALPVTGLLTDTLYYYDVESADALGHTTRDANGGAHYTFRTTEQGEVLLVLGDASFPSDRVAMYRDALTRSAWTFNEWDVETLGDPPLASLQLYKVVIWQTGLEQYPPLTDAQRARVKGYLDGGGRLLLSSHDAAWAFCSTTNNPYYTAQRCAWLRGVMKTVWQDDPSTWSRNNGIAGDPISGPYTAGIPYIGHRSGGYGDEVNNLCGGGATCIGGGALTSYVWRDNEATPDDVSVKWNSTANNGTAGIGVWGGRPSKAVGFWFEFTGLNFVSGVASNAVRTDVLNRTIIWLLDNRDHPAVRVRAPNGGETFTTSPVSIDWIRATSGGSGVATQALYYSANSGQSWNLIGTVAAGTTTYSWDVSALPNGAKYRVKVLVTDDGNPALSGADASDADFAIDRPGADAQGPLIWPGSLSIVPNPIVTGALVTFRATADDSNRGNSDVAVAELFSGAAPGADGTGTPMNPTDGAFDEPTEDVVWAGAAPWPVGPECFWVHARDAAGNWGPFESRCTEITSTAGVDTTPPVATTFASGALANAGADVVVTWNPAADESGIGGTVLYRVLRSTTPTGSFTQISGDILTGTYTFTDVGGGDGAPAARYFYKVQTADAGGNTANSTSLAAKVSFDLPAGTSLVSFPLALSSYAIGTVLQTLTFQEAWTYDGCTEAWLSYSTARPLGRNSLRTVGAGQGLFLDLAAPDRLTVAGVVPTTTRVGLCIGWNLVSYPTFAALTVAQVLIQTGADSVLEFDPAALPGRTRVMAGGEVLQTGRGYWIHASFPVNWNVPGL